MIPIGILGTLGNTDWSQGDNLILDRIIVPLVTTSLSTAVTLWLTLIEANRYIAEEVHFFGDFGKSKPFNAFEPKAKII